MALYDWLNNTSAQGINQATQAINQGLAQDRMSKMAEQEMKIKDFQLKKMQEEDAKMNQPVDVESFLASKGIVHPEEKKMIYDFIGSQGYGEKLQDGRVIVKRRDVQDLMKSAQGDMQFALNLNSTRYMRLSGQADEIRNQMLTMAEKDPVGYTNDEKFKNLSSQLAQINGQTATLDKSITRINQMIKGKDSEPKVVGQGGALVSAQGTPLYVNPKEPTMNDNELIKRALAGDQEAKAMIDEKIRIAKEKTPPIYNFVQTAGGIAPGNVRTGQVGQPVAGKPMPSEMVTSEQQIGTLADTLSAMKQLYKPEYVGPVAGRAGKLAEQTIGVSPDRAAFNSMVAQLNNTLVYLMSGKQINESEMKRLRAQMPSVDLPPTVFKARMAEFERTVGSIVKERQKNMGGYGTNVTPKARPPLESFNK
ncbi:MAG: hypothetical protein PHQ43_09965 [Dehalococcoidales bacterium]|nr:hypothetical protein [Dehalococcoidales bacterium]